MARVKSTKEGQEQCVLLLFLGQDIGSAGIHNMLQFEI